MANGTDDIDITVGGDVNDALEAINVLPEAARKAAADMEQTFGRLSQSLNSGTDTAVAQASIAALDEMLKNGKIDADSYGSAVATIQVDSGLASEASIAAADSLMQLNEQLATGKISSQEYADGVAMLQVSLNESGAAAEAASADFTDITDTEARAGEETTSFADKFSVAVITLNQGLQLIEQAVGAVKRVFDFAEEGAMLERVSTQWEATARDFGVNGDAIVAAMDKATNGTVEDARLMQIAARAFTQGLVTDQTQMVEFTEIARAASVRFGLSTEEALQRVELATETGMSRGLKQIGIIVDFNKGYDELAKRMGKHASDLTDEEKLQSRANTVLEAGADLVKKVGDTGADAATKYEQFTKNTDELGDHLKRNLAEAFTPVVENALTLMTVTDKYNDLMTKHEQEVRMTSSTYKDYETEIVRSGLMTGELNRALNVYTKQQLDAMDADTMRKNGIVLLNDVYYVTGGTVKVATEEQYNFSRSAETAAAAQKHLGDVMGSVDMNSAAATDHISTLADAEAKLIDKTHAASEALASASISILKTEMQGAVTKEIDSYTEKHEQLADKLEKVGAELSKLESTQGRVAEGHKKHALSTAELNLAQLQLAKSTDALNTENSKAVLTSGEYETAHTRLVAAQEHLTAMRDAGNKSTKQYAAATQELHDAQSQLANVQDPMKQAELAVKVEGLTNKIHGQTGAVTSYIDNSKKIAELTGTYDDLTGQIDKLDASHTRATKDILFNIAEQQLATIQDPGIRADAMNKLALQWDMIDKKTYDAVQSMISSTKLLAQDGNIDAWVNRADIELGAINSTAAKAGKDIPDKLLGPVADAVRDHVSSLDKIKSPIENSTTAITKYGDDTTSKLNGPVHSAILAHEYDIKTVGDNLVIITGQAETYLNKLSAIPNKVETDFVTHYTSTGDKPSGQAPSMPNTSSNPAPAPVKGYSGLDMIVPPNPYGAGGDYFPILAAPGEHVRVEPQGQQAHTPGAGTTYIYNTQVYNPLAAAMLLDQQRRDKISHSNTRMGG